MTLLPTSHGHVVSFRRVWEHYDAKTIVPTFERIYCIYISQETSLVSYKIIIKTTNKGLAL